MGPPRRKDRSYSRADKRSARQEARTEIATESAQASEILSSGPCENGTCPFCLGGSDETDFERTRVAAAQRGAI